MKTFVAALALVAQTASQTGYSGLWYREDVESDDPGPRIEEAVRGLVEKTSRGRRTAEDLDPRVMRELRRLVDTFVQYAEELFIEHNTKELVVDDGGQRLRIFYLDAKKHERQMPNGTRLETTATQSGRQIDVFQKTSRGAKIYETYNLSSDGQKLVLTVRLEDKQLATPLVIKSVYSRAE